MPNFSPCITDGNDHIHLSAVAQADESLCGKAVVTSLRIVEDDRTPCPDCARVLLRRVFRLAGSGGMTSIEVTVQA